MEKSEECRRYKWSSLSTKVLVSIWCHDQVQHELNASSRNQHIWDSIARCMSRKGFPVTGLQCRTRIKNMVCSYHEAVRKNDRSSIEPYYDMFKNVLNKRDSEKQESKLIKSKQGKQCEESDENEVSLDSTSIEIEQSANSSATDSEHQMEFLDIINQVPKPSGFGFACSSEVVKQLENVIIKATEAQTRAITNAIQMQSQMIEKLIVAERERLEMALASERESRRQLETRLDSLISKLEVNYVPHVAYVGTVIETPQQQ